MDDPRFDQRAHGRVGADLRSGPVETRWQLNLFVQRVGQGDAETLENVPPQEVAFWNGRRKYQFNTRKRRQKLSFWRRFFIARDEMRERVHSDSSRVDKMEA